jgi:endonuclease YncB( thermonuclease family)
MVPPILSRRQFRRFPVMFLSAMSRLVLATAATAFVSGATAQEACKLPGLGTATVAGVRDGRTLLLTDGRELRLAAIEANDASGAALNTLAAGKMLRLEKLGPEQDRYGRVVAIAYTDDARESLQQVMLAQGEARVSARVGDRPCAELLLKAERAARAAVRGLWAHPNFAPLPSHDVTGITAVRGQFALIEGKVLSVRRAAPQYMSISGGGGRRTSRSPSSSVIGGISRRLALSRRNWKAAGSGCEAGWSSAVVR